MGGKAPFTSYQVSKEKKMNNTNNINIEQTAGFGLMLLAIVLFVPGIFLPMFSLNMEMAIVLSSASIENELLNKELSILGTVKELFEQQRYLVAFLIFAFSVLVPVGKTLLLSMVYFTKDRLKKMRIISFVNTIGKWSMADVFVVAIFLTVMSTNHASTVQQEKVSFFGMAISFELSSQTLSSVGSGFYYFLAYCILSVIASQLILKAQKQT